MSLNLLDNYSRFDSPVRRWPASLKLAVTLSALILTVLLPLSAWGFFLFWALALLGIAVLSRIPAGFLLKRFLLLEPLVLGVAVLALFQPGGRWVFLTIVIKSTLCLFSMILLSNTTPFGELLVLLQRLRIPALLVTTLALMYRYLFVLLDEAERMKRARSSRTFTHTRAQVWKSLATVAGVLFIRTSERAERIYAAMCARGWK